LNNKHFCSLIEEHHAKQARSQTSDNKGWLITRGGLPQTLTFSGFED